MGYQNNYYKVIEKLINLLKLNGFKFISSGTEDEIDLNNVDALYPIAHITTVGGNFDVKITTLDLTLVVADKLDDTGNEFPEYGKDNYIDIQQDLLSKVQTIIRQLSERFNTNYDSIAIGYEPIFNVSFDFFKETTPNLLGGLLCTIQIQFPNVSSEC